MNCANEGKTNIYIDNDELPFKRIICLKNQEKIDEAKFNGIYLEIQKGKGAGSGEIRGLPLCVVWGRKRE